LFGDVTIDGRFGWKFVCTLLVIRLAVRGNVQVSESGTSVNEVNERMKCLGLQEQQENELKAVV
jgi:hypothetical protein